MQVQKKKTNKKTKKKQQLVFIQHFTVAFSATWKFFAHKIK